MTGVPGQMKQEHTYYPSETHGPWMSLKQVSVGAKGVLMLEDKEDVGFSSRDLNSIGGSFKYQEIASWLEVMVTLAFCQEIDDFVPDCVDVYKKR